MAQTAGRNKIHSTIYYTETSYRLLDRLAEDMGLNKTAVVEFAIRELAKKRKIDATETQQERG